MRDSVADLRAKDHDVGIGKHSVESTLNAYMQALKAFVDAKMFLMTILEIFKPSADNEAVAKVFSLSSRS